MAQHSVRILKVTTTIQFEVTGENGAKQSRTITYEKALHNAVANAKHIEDGTLLASSVKSIDLNGPTDEDFQGDPLAFSNIKLFALINRSNNAGSKITVGGNANPWLGMLSAATDKLDIGPGGFLLWVSPTDGAAVADGANDVVDLDPGTNQVDYDLLIAGAE